MKLLFQFIGKNHPEATLDFQDDKMVVITDEPLTVGETTIIKSIVTHSSSSDKTPSHDVVETDPSET